MQKKVDAKRLTTLAMLLTAAFILSWIELMVSLPMVVPGIKIGLANLAILFSIYYCGSRDTLGILCGRLVLNAILFGNAASLIYSVSGGLLSFAVMCIAKKILPDKMITVSIIGGVFHNIGQLAAAMVVLKTPMLIYYMPYLIIGGIAAGAFNGFVVKRILSCSFFSSKNITKIS